MSGGRNAELFGISSTAQPDERIAAVAGRQGGHVTRPQLIELGLGKPAIEYRLRVGRLIPVHRGVYAVGHVPANELDRAHGALLAAGENSALAGDSAMALYGISEDWPDPIELLATTDRRPPTLNVHRCRTLLRRDIVIRQGLRVTSPARTLLDIAPRLHERRLIRAINQLRMDHSLTVEAIADVVARNPRHPGTKRLRVELARAQSEPTRSQLEETFLELLRVHGLPTPLVNVQVAGYRVDALFPEHRLIVELDGWATHGTRHAFRRDRRQDAEILAATGIPTIRLSYEDTTAHARETAERLLSILSSRG